LGGVNRGGGRCVVAKKKVRRPGVLHGGGPRGPGGTKARAPNRRQNGGGRGRAHGGSFFHLTDRRGGGDPRRCGNGRPGRAPGPRGGVFFRGGKAPGGSPRWRVKKTHGAAEKTTGCAGPGGGGGPHGKPPGGGPGQKTGHPGRSKGASFPAPPAQFRPAGWGVGRGGLGGAQATPGGGGGAGGNKGPAGGERFRHGVAFGAGGGPRETHPPRGAHKKKKAKRKKNKTQDFGPGPRGVGGGIGIPRTKVPSARGGKPFNGAGVAPARGGGKPSFFRWGRGHPLTGGGPTRPLSPGRQLQQDL